MREGSFITPRSTLIIRIWGAIAAVALALLPAHSPAQGPAPDYDFDWVTIGNVNNPGYNGPLAPGGFPSGRGSVGYVFRMSRLEVTTAQWMEYVNTFTTQSDSMSFFLDQPLWWGARSDLGYQGPGRRYQLDPGDPNPALSPVAGISWRDAARFCNWLHNGKSSDVSSLATGAYDTSTWGPGTVPGTYTDAERRLPGARFWIPSLDEALKAGHFDPHKNGEGLGGWWDYSNRSDTTGPVSGRPGLGESSAGTNDWSIPLGSYAGTRSAYGLLDLSGGAREWLEDIRPTEVDTLRYFDGASVGDRYIGDDAELSLDRASRFGSDDPTFNPFGVGVRIASIPASAAGLLCGPMWLFTARRKRR